MMLAKATTRAMREETEKSGISLKVPSDLKVRLQAEADESGVSMNALISAMIEVVLDEKNGSADLEGIYEMVQNVNAKIEEAEEHYEPEDAERACKSWKNERRILKSVLDDYEIRYEG